MRLWTKNYVITIIINLLIFIVFFLYMQYIANMAIVRFGASVSSAGLASGLFIIGAIFARVIAGHYLDWFGRKKALLISCGFSLVFSILYHLIYSLSFLYLIRGGHGFFYGVAASVTSTTITAIVPPERRGEGIGYFGLSVVLGSAIGPFLGITLSQFNLIYPIYFCDIIAVITFLLAFTVKIPEIAIGFRQRIEMKAIKLRTFIEKSALPISFVSLLSALGYSGVMSFIGAYSTYLGFIVGGSLFYIVYAAVCLFCRPLAGRLLDSRGNNIVMYPATIFMVLSFICIAFAQNDWMLLLGAALIGMGYGTIVSAGAAICVQNVRPQHFSLAIATLYIFLDTGNGVGPYILGLIVPIFGFRYVYLLSAFFALLAAIAYHFLIGRQELKKKQTLSS